MRARVGRTFSKGRLLQVSHRAEFIVYSLSRLLWAGAKDGTSIHQDRTFDERGRRADPLKLARSRPFTTGKPRHTRVLLSKVSRIFRCDVGIYYGISSLTMEMVLVSSTSESLLPDVIEIG
jgi:hypothetical protein